MTVSNQMATLLKVMKIGQALTTQDELDKQNVSLIGANLSAATATAAAAEKETQATKIPYAIS